MFLLIKLFNNAEGSEFKLAFSLIYELSNGIPYYMQILAYSCFEETNEDNEVTMAEFKKASVYSLNILAQREFKALFSKSTTEERKILCLMAESDETVLSYSYIKENANLNSEPSAFLRSSLQSSSRLVR